MLIYSLSEDLNAYKSEKEKITAKFLTGSKAFKVYNRDSDYHAPIMVTVEHRNVDTLKSGHLV